MLPSLLAPPCMAPLIPTEPTSMLLPLDPGNAAMLPWPMRETWAPNCFAGGGGWTVASEQLLHIAPGTTKCADLSHHHWWAEPHSALSPTVPRDRSCILMQCIFLACAGRHDAPRSSASCSGPLRCHPRPTGAWPSPASPGDLLLQVGA